MVPSFVGHVAPLAIHVPILLTHLVLEARHLVLEGGHVVFEGTEFDLGAHLGVVEFVELDADTGHEVLDRLLEAIDAFYDSGHDPILKKRQWVYAQK